MNAVATPNTRRALSLAIVLYLLWVFATYLLEGRIHTLLRPEAMGARLSYALVANILILRRIPLPRTPVNKGSENGRGLQRAA